MKTSRYITPLLLSLVIAASIPAGAQENKRDPKVQVVIDQLVAAYRGLSALHLKMTMQSNASDPGILPPRVTEVLECRYQKPNRLWTESVRKFADGDVQRSRIVCDGKNLWRWDSATNRVSRERAPQALHAVGGLPDIAPELEVLLRNRDPFRELPPDAQCSLGKPEKAGDADVDVLEIKIPSSDTPIAGSVRLLIGQKDHLVRGMTYSGSGKDPKTGKDVHFKVELAYALVNAAPAFAASAFSFTPPPGAKMPPPEKRAAAKAGQKPAVKSPPKKR